MASDAFAASDGRGTIEAMNEPQNTSSVTILIRLFACATMGLGIVLLFARILESVGPLEIRVSGAALILAGAFGLAANPRNPANPPAPNPDGPRD